MPDFIYFIIRMVLFVNTKKGKTVWIWHIIIDHDKIIVGLLVLTKMSVIRFFFFTWCFVALFKCKVCETVQTTDLSQVYLWSVGEISINMDSGLVYITLRDVWRPLTLRVCPDRLTVCMFCSFFAARTVFHSLVIFKLVYIIKTVPD